MKKLNFLPLYASFFIIGCGPSEKQINEEPEKDTYWMITKANRDNLISMGGNAAEIGKSATNNFKKYCK